VSKKESPQNSGRGETTAGCGCLAVLALLIGVGLLGSFVSDDEPTAKDPDPMSTAIALAAAKPEAKKLASQVGKHLNTGQNAAIKAGLTFTRYDSSGQERPSSRCRTRPSPSDFARAVPAGDRPVAPCRLGGGTQGG
jgi:hypothetical protein